MNADSSNQENFEFQIVIDFYISGLEPPRPTKDFIDKMGKLIIYQANKEWESKLNKYVKYTFDYFEFHACSSEDF